MDFFAYKAQAKRNTLALYILFFIAVLLIDVAVYVAAMVSEYLMAFFIRDMASPTHFWDILQFLIVSGITMLMILAGSWYKIHKLRQGGGSAVAEMLGGRELRNSHQPLERQLRNVVEEMAIASGLPVPRIYILEQAGINAFAAGDEPKTTVIAVTRGAIEMLNRHALQGVIAHEFSHILHGDTTLKMKMMGLFFGITMISDLGILMIAGRSSTKYSTSPRASHPLLMLSGMLFFMVGLIGMLAADMIKAALSRQREYLADASAVQFTRNPAGIANALKVIGGYKAGSRLDMPQAHQVSHLFFGDALKSWWDSNWWATHPPLVARIQRIEPGFRGRLTSIDATKVRLENQASAVSMFSPPPGFGDVSRSVDQVMRSIGEPDASHLHMAEQLLQAIPEALHEQLSDPVVAKAVVFFLLQSADKEEARQQMRCLSAADESAVLAVLIRLRHQLSGLAGSLRLPLMDLITPTLLALSGQEKKDMMLLMRQIIALRQPIDFFSYLLFQHFLSVFSLKRHTAHIAVLHLDALQAESGQLLSLLCSFNTNIRPTIVFEHAMAMLYSQQTQRMPMPAAMPLDDITKLSAMLRQLNRCSFADKEKLLKAVVYCILSDGLVNEQEIEVMRLVSMLLGCPMPPLYAAK